MSDLVEARIDEHLASRVSDPTGDLLAETGEKSWFELGRRQFVGTYGWVTWSIMISVTVTFLAGVYCAFQFFAATETLAAVKWGLSGAVLLLMSIQMKVGLMPQMQADRVIREVRRLQLLVTAGN